MAEDSVGGWALSAGTSFNNFWNISRNVPVASPNPRAFLCAASEVDSAHSSAAQRRQKMCAPQWPHIRWLLFLFSCWGWTAFCLQTPVVAEPSPSSLPRQCCSFRGVFTPHRDQCSLALCLFSDRPLLRVAAYLRNPCSWLCSGEVLWPYFIRERLLLALREKSVEQFEEEGKMTEKSEMFFFF